MEIYIENSTNNNTTDFEDTVKQAITESLRYEGILFDCEISVTFVTEDEIKSLNSEHRNINEVTDVLSFPLLDGKAGILALNKQTDNRNRRGGPLCPPEIVGNGSKPFHTIALGDIVICLSRAMEQSAAYGHSIAREIGFLTAHSMLHLLGYDHMTEADEKEMFHKQEEILSNINLAR